MMIWRAVKRAQIQAVKEPAGLLRRDGKRPDGATLIPWARGKSMAWSKLPSDLRSNLYLRSTHDECHDIIASTCLCIERN